jgi:hypothetical protein
MLYIVLENGLVENMFGEDVEGRDEERIEGLDFVKWI